MIGMPGRVEAPQPASLGGACLAKTRPRRLAGGLARVQEKSLMRQEADEPAEGAPQVILLEDDAAQRDLLLELFADEGITVEVCATLADPGRSATAPPIDRGGRLVGGRRARRPRRAAALGDRRAQPSGAADPDHRAGVGSPTQAGQLGNVVVPKPYDLDDLIERVRCINTGWAD